MHDRNELDGMKRTARELEKTIETNSIAWLMKENAKRWFVVAMTILFLWFATIGVFVVYLSLYDFSSETTEIEAEQDGEGVNIVGGGDVNNGAESKLDKNNQKTNP